MFGGNNVTLLLRIHFKVEGNGRLVALGDSKAFGSGELKHAYKLTSKDSENWEGKVEVPVSDGVVTYKYGVLYDDKRRFEAIQSVRSISLQGLRRGTTVLCKDTWRSPKSNVFVSKAFREAIFAGNAEGGMNQLVRSDSELGDKSAALIWREPAGDSVMVRFLVVVPRLTYGHTVHITGEHPMLGEWEGTLKVPLVNMGKNLYSIILEVPREELGFEYKYCIYDENDEFVFRERATPRTLEVPPSDIKYVSVDESFKYETVWKGAGVAVPVFSLRTEQSIGIGEFLDLKKLVDWSNKVGLTMVQVLPVNDSGDNPSPYSATSVFALHPVYINVQAVAAAVFGGGDRVPGEIQGQMDGAKHELNQLKKIDYTKVLTAKTQILEAIFKAGGEDQLANAEFKAWLDANESWLPTYACWKTIMNKTGEWVFTKWEYNIKDVPRLTGPESEFYEDVRFHYFVQYNLHLQLKEASEYAKVHGVALKGDLPIGVARYCADTWGDTAMFQMEWSAGAPEYGRPPAQNWDFPLYNWPLMKKDGYQWWRRRLQAMEQYFHAFRIDHVLGFFRIWAIPHHNYSGMLGRYDPCPKPITLDEIKGLGISEKNLERYTEPYMTEKSIAKSFGEKAKFVEEKFLEKSKSGRYTLKEEVDTIAKVHEEVYHWKYDEDLTDEERNLVRQELCDIIDNRIFIQDEKNPKIFYLTCCMYHQTSYKDLTDEGLKEKLSRLWHNFFWERQSWREDGYEKLAAMQDAANMMICAEDLGAVPDEAYEVLEALGILGLRIQRWPIKGPWGVPDKYSYLTIAAPSCHDCSTVRQWWAEDRGARQHFYHCNFGGEGPWECYDWVSQKIVEQHFNGNSMWAVIPIQDYLDMWDELRSLNPEEDVINHPGTSEGNWEYRMQLPLEELCGKNTFNSFFSSMIERTGRRSSY